MIFFPLALVFALALFFLGLFVLALVQVGLIGAAFAKLGLPPQAVPLVLLGSLLGSGLNIPVRRIQGPPQPAELDLLALGFRFRMPVIAPRRETILAVNLGGAVIPTLVSLYLLGRAGSPLGYLAATLAVTWVVHRFARPVPGFGIAVPLLVPPAAAAIAALVFSPAEAGPAAYVAGTLGCLLGADLLNLPKIARLGAPIASIGGAGTFDGVFLSGVIAVFLAA